MRVTKKLLAVLFALAAVGAYRALAQPRPFRASDEQVAEVLARVEKNSDWLRRNIETALAQSVLKNTEQGAYVREFLQNFAALTARMRARFGRREPISADVLEALDRGVYVESFVHSYDLGEPTKFAWEALRGDLDRLAECFTLPTRWTSRRVTPTGPPLTGPDVAVNRLIGTYRLAEANSSLVREGVERLTSALPVSERRSFTQMFENRLTAPAMLAIDRNGSLVTLASSRSGTRMYAADGVARTERLGLSQTASVIVRAYGDQLQVRSDGNRGYEYSVTYDAVDQGARLRVTRRVMTPALRRPIVMTSYYLKISDAAHLDLITNEEGAATLAGDKAGSAFVPGGTRLVTELNHSLSAAKSRPGERFNLKVESPAEYEGATIEGFVTGVSSGGLQLNFERIVLRDGRAYNFAGQIAGVRASGGKELLKRLESQLQPRKQPARTTAANQSDGSLSELLAVMSLAGEGSAAGAGSASAFLQGRDGLELRSGTQIILRAAQPR